MPVEDLQLIIITGLSGAGKSQAVHILEDLGYFCVDNLPPALVSKFAELCAQSAGTNNKIALVMDIRGGDFFNDLAAGLADLEGMGFYYRILFLEASDRALIRRFKETRRPHPLAPHDRILEAIQQERRKLEELRGRADVIIDTTDMQPERLKETIIDQLLSRENGSNLVVSVLSFGFKYGLPLDADLLFDLRFLPNPHYVEGLRSNSGLEYSVQKYVLEMPVSREFRRLFFNFIDFLLPNYIAEGKSHLVVGIGCTGGRHRSVAVANRLAGHLKEQGFQVNELHRDIDKHISRDGSGDL